MSTQATTESSQVTPFLWLDGCAREAADFYVSIFRNSGITNDTMLTGPAAGSAMVSFVLNGQPFIAFDGHPAFEFTPAVSFVVNCDTQEELDHYWERLAKDGNPIQCGWIQDKFGVHWQIVPTILQKLMEDEGTSAPVLEALLTMGKIDIQRLLDATDERG